MKTLLILRHAKAQPDAPNGDHARSLTGRGRRDASTIGFYISSQLGMPDGIVTSDARRALETAELVAAGCRFPAPLTVESDIYGADADGLVSVVRRMPDAAACVVIVGHNPGMEDLVALLTGSNDAVQHLPTSGLAHLEHNSDRWRDLAPGSCSFRGMTSPRLLANQTAPASRDPHSVPEGGPT